MDNDERRVGEELAAWTVGGIFALMVCALIIDYVGRLNHGLSAPPEWFVTLCSTTITSVLSIAGIKVITRFAARKKAKEIEDKAKQDATPSE